MVGQEAVIDLIDLIRLLEQFIQYTYGKPLLKSHLCQVSKDRVVEVTKLQTYRRHFAHETSWQAPKPPYHHSQQKQLDKKSKLHRTFGTQSMCHRRFSV